MAKLLIFNSKNKKPIALHGGILKEEGFELSYTSTQKETTDILEQKNISFLIINGIETNLLSDIRKFFPFQKTVISVNPEDYEQGNEYLYSASYKIIKAPYSTNELIAVLRKYENQYKSMVTYPILHHMIDLYEIVKSSETKINFKEYLQNSFEFIVSYLKADNGSLMLVDTREPVKDNEMKLRIAASLGIDNEIVQHSIIKSGERIAGWVTKNKKSLILDNTNLNSLPFSDLSSRSDITSSMVILLEGENEPLGVLSLNSLGKRKFAQRDMDILSIYTKKISTFIQKMISVQDLTLRFNEMKLQNKEMETFIYSAFHDLKTPLFTLEGFLEQFKEYMCDKIDDKGSTYLNGISHGAFKLENMIKDAFEFFKYSKMQYKKEQIKSSELLELALDQLQIMLKTSSATIIKDSPDEKWPFIQGDKYQLVKIWVNLLSNAVKYKDNKRKPVIHLGFKNDTRDMITFYVKDNGIGIDQQFFDFIFGVFTRLRDKEKVEGTGVGLSIVKKIITHHNGNIWVESKKGQGSTFYFSLPAWIQ
jgi:signal transduction histidine kinase